MSVISTIEIAMLKKEAEEKFSAAVHFHDSCGGQSFSLSKTSEELREYITAFFKERSVTIKFTPDGLQFYTVS